MSDVVASAMEDDGPQIPNQHKPKEFTLNMEQLKDLLYNQSSRDQTFLKRFFDPRRDIDNECGYPGLGESPEVTQYKAFYDTHCVATRAVEIYPLETWQVQPSIFEDDDPNIQTEFEKAWDELGSSLKGQSWHKNEEGSPVWNYLMNADILSGIGSFGIILLGFDDGGQLNEPMPMLADEDNPEEEKTWDTTEDPESDDLGPTLTGNQLGSIDAQYTGGSSLGVDKVPTLKDGTKRKLIYMRAFDESLVQITRLELDRTSPRYGQPLMYRVTLLDPELAKSQSISMDLSCPEVHWTRVIHIAETKGSNSEVFGIPRQQQVWRQLLNLYKLYGGAPEMYWRGALNGLSFETHPQLGGDVIIDNDSLKNQIENYRNSLQRDLTTSGMTVKSIAPTVVDPNPNIEVQIQAICIKLACPQRIFMGSERGELASSQDDSSWNDRLKNRQNVYVTPHIIVPFVDRMIAAGVLPKPSNRVIGQTGEDNPSDQSTTDQENLPLDSSQEETNGNGKPVTNAFPPSNSSKTAKTAPSSPPNGQLGGKPTFGKPSGTSDPTQSGVIAPPAPKKRLLPDKDGSPGYCVVWPDLDSMTDAQKATIGLQRTQALMAFIAGNGESAMSLVDFYTKMLMMTDEEAVAVIQATNEAIEADERMTPDPEEQRQDEMDMQGEQFDKELQAKKDLAEQGHGFGMEMQDKEQGFQEKMAAKAPKKPTANFNPSQPRDNGGRWSSGGGSGNSLHAAIADRFGISEQAVSDLLSTDVKELRRRDDYLAPNNTMEPTTDFEQFPVGAAKIGSFGDPENSYIEEMRTLDPKKIVTSEAEDGIKLRSPSYPKYVEWAKQGIEPPPISVGESSRGNGVIVSSNRRRVLAAQDAGVTSIKAWYSPINKETGNPLKYGDVLKAAKGGQQAVTTNSRVIQIIAKYLGIKSRKVEEVSDATKPS